MFMIRIAFLVYSLSKLMRPNPTNSKAPKWCTIDVEFTPINDLNPGIDSNGNMIAPIYNIGNVLAQMKVNRSQNNNSK